MQLDCSHSGSEEYVQLNFEDLALSEEESKLSSPKKSSKASSIHLQVTQIQKQALASPNHSSSNGYSPNSKSGHNLLPLLKLSALSAPQLSTNDHTSPTSPRPFHLPLREDLIPSKRKVATRLNSSKTNKTSLEAQPSFYAPKPSSINSPHSEPSSTRDRSIQSNKKLFLKQSEEVLASFEALYQTINAWRRKEIGFDPETSLVETVRISEIFIQTLKSKCREQWLIVVDKVNALFDEQPFSPTLSSRSSDELTSRPRSVSLPMFGEYLHDPYSISLQESLKQDGISLSKQSAIRSAIHPLLSACLIDLSKPLTDKPNMKQMLKILDLSKPDSDFIVLVKYRQSLVQLVAILSHPSHDIATHVPKGQQQLVATFLGSLRQSKEVKLANGEKESLMTEYRQDSIQLLYKSIEALDKAIQTHFYSFVESMQGLHPQLCHQAYDILFKRPDRHFEANLIRAIEGKYLHLIKKKKSILLTPAYLKETGDQRSAIQRQNALLLRKKLRSLLRFFSRHLTPDVDVKTGYQNWFTGTLSSQMPLTKERVMKEFAAQYAALHQEWGEKMAPELEPEAFDTLLNQFPMYKIGIVLGLFNQEFLKGITGKIIELHKHLTNNHSSCPIKSSTLEDHLSKKIRIEFKEHCLFFMAKRIGNLELDPGCRLTTISRFQAPIDHLACLSISYELVVDLPDHPLIPEAAQQLEEILMIAQTMGLTIKMPSHAILSQS
ncbi:conserved hypothetical protein [Candidatus Protochlamydia naegleriophila]|uniref:Uncharacterized protein n=1 Tax=Candidatus Protochlamydia naegleriophila TaxID=389348 RepID=A0A0U5JG04_9BACT|nr:hypothetical protein [Candidatus Protochlamydia naegleriophila]CUI17311.1 conserved hypothetical protein [Candidatus Protochlamydia naegleriophila]